MLLILIFSKVNLYTLYPFYKPIKNGVLWDSVVRVDVTRLIFVRLPLNPLTNFDIICYAHLSHGLLHGKICTYLMRLLDCDWAMVFI
jgi:hypothetical protein